MCILPEYNKILPLTSKEPKKRYSHTGHTFFIIGGVLASLVVVFSSLTLALNRTSWSGRAQTPTTGGVSRENSYLFASPLKAAADGKSLIRVTVFILNSQGLGVGGQPVDLDVSGPLNIAKIQPVTDTLGRAIFDTTSTVPGDYTLSVSTGDLTLSQKAVVSFH